MGADLSPTHVDPEKRFDDFVVDPVYLLFKRHIYSYLYRKAAVTRRVKRLADGSALRLLEVGSGVAPIGPPSDHVILTDLSVHALARLRQEGVKGHAIAMSATANALRLGSADVVVCSEVLEHIADDDTAIAEVSRVLRPGGSLILTVPCNPRYFTFDDAFVKHQRRYEIPALLDQLRRAGLEIVEVAKLAAVLEKVATLTLVRSFVFLHPLLAPFAGDRRGRGAGMLSRALLPLYVMANHVFAVAIRLEGRLMPWAATSMVLVHARKPAASAHVTLPQALEASVDSR